MRCISMVVVFVILLLVLCDHVEATHKLKLLHQHTLQAKEMSSANWGADPFICAANGGFVGPDKCGGQLHAANEGYYAGTGVPGWSGWITMMHNFPPANSAVVAGCGQNGYTVASICGAANVPNHNGIYAWGTANPVKVGLNWQCPGGGAVSQKYVGRAIVGDTMLARCQNYNPNAASWANVGSHKQDKFREALNQCKCIYYKFRDYSNFVAPYYVCGSGSQNRRVRKWKWQRSPVDSVKHQEYTEITTTAGGYGQNSNGAEWNGNGGENVPTDQC